MRGCVTKGCREGAVEDMSEGVLEDMAALVPSRNLYKGIGRALRGVSDVR